MTRTKRRWIGMAAVAAAVLLTRCGGASDVSDDQSPQSGATITGDGGVFTACTATEQCLSGQICRHGLCQPSPEFLQSGATAVGGQFCLKPSDCSLGQVCANSRCVGNESPEAQAARDGGTPILFVFDGGIPHKPVCSTDTDCPDGLTCQQNRCVQQ